MSWRRRSCVECRKCFTRYVIASSPYPNGSFVVRQGRGFQEELALYCTCANPPAITHCGTSEIKRYVLSIIAHDRGYGSPKEIVSAENLTRGKSNAPR
jgi:hypothetical protein